MMHLRSASGKRWQGKLLQPFLHFHDTIEHAPVRRTQVRTLAVIGALGMPLYYWLWQHVFPQEYESPLLRGVAALLFLPALWPGRFSNTWFSVYLFLGLTFELPFFFTYMFLMNHASVLWVHSLLVALIVLFHFDARIAMLAYLSGTLLACLAFAVRGDPAVMLSREVLQQLPVHWFTIAVLSVVKVGRHVGAQEKLAGLAAGLGSVAHELRTPLVSVEANVRGLQRSAAALQADAASQDALARIQFEVRHMHHMIDLFLLSASTVNRKLEANETVAMQDSVATMLRRYPFTSAAQRDLVKVDVRADFTFDGQSELCAAILLNLLRNALKGIQRAGKGRVRIIVDGARPVPRLLFIDTGCGIAASRLPLIFDRFYSYPAHNGSGIGLALCLQIMQAWHARIRCVARENAYAIFVLEFPHPVSTPRSSRFPSIHRAR
ncbi:sensor histidine kinase [Janthinobacterium sp. BJB1]|uniref:sensor histidine kinase n=1 Tax=Janthinobacterium sp. GW458P TaxID=1981504 RepID=UPI000A31ED68|nr:HAMP domain-containing sensor histidine kinase [Janthinobacterium sp. GW458P]MBE3023423.1 HAMP domain-containing histidine kinase [Janthinobacterium sp. GW458P]PHV18888.1 sensor histidine kinase [Janthinobacterium sp. BJB303]PJC98341.1 sensor histidine kinase [Janthinobacterium sp. BJB1]